MMFTYLGCWLGNPAATDAKQRVWTTRTTPDKFASAEFTAKNAPKLALNLMRALFSDDELVNGCCTPSPSGYKILDQTIIGGIRSKFIDNETLINSFFCPIQCTSTTSSLPVAWMTKRYDGSQYYKAI